MDFGLCVLLTFSHFMGVLSACFSQWLAQMSQCMPTYVLATVLHCLRSVLHLLLALFNRVAHCRFPQQNCTSLTTKPPNPISFCHLITSTTTHDCSTLIYFPLLSNYVGRPRADTFTHLSSLSIVCAYFCLLVCSLHREEVLLPHTYVHTVHN